MAVGSSIFWLLGQVVTTCAFQVHSGGFDSPRGHCVRGRLGNAPDCGSGLCEFKSRRTPFIWEYRKVVLHAAVNRATLVQFQVFPFYLEEQNLRGFIRNGVYTKSGFWLYRRKVNPSDCLSEDCGFKSH